MAGKGCTKGRKALVLAGFLLAAPQLALAQAPEKAESAAEGTFSSLFRLENPFTPKRRRKAAENPPLPSLRGASPDVSFRDRPRTATPGEPSYLQSQPAPPAGRTQVQVQGPVRGFVNLLEGQTTQAPVYDPSASALATGSIASAPPSPPRRVREQEDDPYAPLGLRRGSFILRPSIEAAFGADSNVNRTPGSAISSAYTRLKPEFLGTSNWSRHQLTFRLGAERHDYFTGDLEARNDLDAEIKSRIDIRRGTELELGASYTLRQDSDALATSGLPFSATGRPQVQTYEANTALSQQFGRMGLRLRGEIAERDFGATSVSGGSSISNDDRDVTDMLLALRTSYEWTPALRPFVESEYNRHDYDIPIDGGGFEKGSDGFTGRAGVMFDFGPLLSGEVALGILYQTPFEPVASNYTGVTFDGNLNWSPTPLTTVRFAASTMILDDALVGAIGGVQHDASIKVEHALRRNVLLTSSLGYGLDNYEGIARTDNRVRASLSAAWKVNRNAELQTKLEHGSLFSSLPGEDVSGTLYEVGIKLQY